MELAFNIVLIILGLLFSLSLFAKQRTNAQTVIVFRGVTAQRLLIAGMLFLVLVASFFIVPLEWMAWVRTASLLLAIGMTLFYVEGVTNEHVVTMRTPVTYDEIILYGVYQKTVFGTKIYLQLKPTENELKEARAKGVKPDPRWMNFHFFSSNRNAIFDFLLKKLGKEKQISSKTRAKTRRK
jgi:hypothetical protein